MAEPPDKQAAEHRNEPRRRVLLTGKLVYGFPEMTLDCAISDVSRTGARVRLAGPEALTDPIYLINVRHGLAFLAREAWRRGSLVGLEFVRYWDLRAPEPGLPPIVRRLWVEQTRSG
jgi:hypothetical protein